MSDARVPVQPEILDACKASEPDALRRRILDPNLPKNEAEHWASAEISRLTARVAELEKALAPFRHLAKEAEGLPDSHAFELVWWYGDDTAAEGIFNSKPDPIITARQLRVVVTTLEASERGGE